MRPQRRTGERVNLAVGNHMKKIIFFFLLITFALPHANPFFKISRSREINPDYTQTYWDHLMKGQSVYDINRGLNEMQTQNYETALNAFAKALIKNPKDAYAHIFFGMALYWTGKVDAAMSEYRQAIAIDDKNAEAYQLLGIACGWKGDIKQAKENFLTADRLDPKRPDVKMNLSSVFASENDLETAIDYARQAVNLSSRSPLYHFHLGTLFEAIGRDAQAAESWTRAIKLFPRYEDAVLSLAAMREKRAENEDALSYYKKAVNLKPGDFVARLRYSNLLFVTGAREAARAVAAEAFKISPSSGGGLALDIAYSSSDNPSADEQTKNEEAENLKKTLSQFAPSQALELEMQIQYSPLPKLEARAQESALEREVRQTRNEQNTKTFQRSFVLNAASAEERAAQIENIAEGVSGLLDSAAPDQQVKFAMKVSAPQRSAPKAISDKQSAYNPRSVGNDMGLWVTGRSWIRFVEEITPDIYDRLDMDAPDAFDYILAGLADLTLGRGESAFNNFSKAENSQERELAVLGQGTALIVLGREPEALEYFNRVLDLNPKNKVAAFNIKVLTPAVK